jgi:hypothetical protein
MTAIGFGSLGACSVCWDHNCNCDPEYVAFHEAQLEEEAKKEEMAEQDAQDSPFRRVTPDMPRADILAKPRRGFFEKAIVCSDSGCERPGLNKAEPAPIKNNQPAIWPLVIEDMKQRDLSGRAKYGTPLQAFNGRKPLVDLYQELLDAVVYVRQAIEEAKSIDELKLQVESLKQQVSLMRRRRR